MDIEEVEISFPPFWITRRGVSFSGTPVMFEPRANAFGVIAHGDLVCFYGDDPYEKPTDTRNSTIIRKGEPFLVHRDDVPGLETWIGLLVHFVDGRLTELAS